METLHRGIETATIHPLYEDGRLSKLSPLFAFCRGKRVLISCVQSPLSTDSWGNAGGKHKGWYSRCYIGNLRRHQTAAGSEVDVADGDAAPFIRAAEQASTSLRRYSLKLPAVPSAFHQSRKPCALIAASTLAFAIGQITRSTVVSMPPWGYGNRALGAKGSNA